jgi:1-acyl-sn-glycerol-3-phosphate acyltransferase
VTRPRKKNARREAPSRAKPKAKAKTRTRAPAKAKLKPKAKSATASPRVQSRAKTEPARTPKRGPQRRPRARHVEAGEPISEDSLGIGARMVPLPPSDPLPTEPPPSSAPTAPPEDVAAHIRALEARIDSLIRGSAPPEPTREVIPVRATTLTPTRAADDLGESSYLERRWGREGLRSRSEEVDDFGLDPKIEQRFRPIAEFLTRRYFRTRVEGLEHVPSSGRGIIVANHSGTLPLDGLVLRAVMRLEHPAERDLRWLSEDFLFYLPFAGVFMNRVGAVRACQENAERLLRKEGLVAVFPEGLQGIRKLFRERYQLQRFGRGGYVRLALRMQAPLVPCAIVGAEETNPLLYRMEAFAGLFGLPYIPITPTFPLLGPAGLLPAPARFRIMFGEPISLDNYGPEAADDDLLVGRLSERVRSTIQSMLDTGVRERRSVWFG